MTVCVGEFFMATFCMCIDSECRSVSAALKLCPAISPLFTAVTLAVIGTIKARFLLEGKLRGKREDLGFVGVLFQ